jgi:hypothetical protein
MGSAWLEADFLDDAFKQGLVEPYAAVASDTPHQPTCHSRQRLQVQDDAIAALDLSVANLNHAPIA